MFVFLSYQKNFQISRGKQAIGILVTEIFIVPGALQDPAVQSIISLTSSLEVKMLNVQVSTISKSQGVLLKKCE